MRIFATDKYRVRALSVAFFFTITMLRAQPAYFQQEVNYQMQVRLNDENHSLHAFASIWYINHSPSQLHYLYFHLWPNAYKNSNTALCKQLLLRRRTDLYFSRPEEQGYIDSLDFKVNGKPVTIQNDSLNPDVCKLLLNEPLRAGDSILITTPFFVKIPDAKFSRLGHTGQAYYITQWYPKPAVYDNSGWHPMPYLDQGEFYSEFGSFDVSITLPANYMLAATGNRINAGEEEKLLEEKIAETQKLIESKAVINTQAPVPQSAPHYKTVQFKQNNVHDFAWFADKSFYVLRGQVQMPESGKNVATWAFFTPSGFALWKDALTYINEATLFYSKALGDYPYDHVTAVDGTIMAGGGMEYPNITVIGNMSGTFDLDVTIAHEVGHNWFYGILANNERRYPFMDEGLNSYYEMRYVQTRYPNRKLSEYLPGGIMPGLFGLNKLPARKEKEIAFMFSLRQRTDQPLNLPAEDYSEINYATVVYCKTPVIFDYLAEYMGHENFEKAMKSYYSQYKFRHVEPVNLFNVLRRYGNAVVDTFEKHLIHTTNHINYKIKQIKRLNNGSYEIKLKNKTGVALPFNVSGYKDGLQTKVQWYNGFVNYQTDTFPVGDFDYLKIDGQDNMPDINRRNNIIKTNGVFKKLKPLQFNFISAIENPAKTQVGYLPLLGANFYNGFMLGLALHNYNPYRKHIEYVVAPMYGFRSKTLAGLAELGINMFPRTVFKQFSVGVTLKSFAYDDFKTEMLNKTNGTNFKEKIFDYVKITPFVEAELKNKNANSTLKQLISMRRYILFAESLNTAQSDLVNLKQFGPQTKGTVSTVSELNYELRNKRAIDPFFINATMQQARSMLKVYGNFNYRYTLGKSYEVEFNIFGGMFLQGNGNDRAYYAFRPSGYNGWDDYTFSGNFVIRNERANLRISQFMEKDANMKVYTFLFSSPAWMTALNIKSPKLYVLPVKIFADVMFCSADALNGEKMLWDFGVNISLLKGMADIYIPLLYSVYIKDKLDINDYKFLERIRFTLNIHKLGPRNIIQGFYNN